jgi:hypothetical protein
MIVPLAKALAKLPEGSLVGEEAERALRRAGVGS